MKESDLGLSTDLYQLKMVAGYLDANIVNLPTTFDLFVRKLPSDWGYLVACGIDKALDFLTQNPLIPKWGIKKLEKRGVFKSHHLDYFRELKFRGDVHAVKEGEVFTANEPILRVTGALAETQFVETALLSLINYPILVASKASRIVNAAYPVKVIEFGLRRGPGMDASFEAARASYIAGMAATSNVYAGLKLDIPVSGTQGHSFVMSFPAEEESFRAYLKTFPDNETLLIDTYDTAEGARLAVKVAKELEVNGHKLGAVRIDSGDIAKDAKNVRGILDRAGLDYVGIIATSDLDEYEIQKLFTNEAPIRGFGVGTRNITGHPYGALSGVYKIAEVDGRPVIKLSSDKITYPGKKQIYRASGVDGNFLHDTLALEGEIEGVPLLEAVIVKGEKVRKKSPLGKIREFSLSRVARLPQSTKRITNPVPYPLKVSPGLRELIATLKKEKSWRF